ncbi:hypothetical protein [Maridesulfovibrio sp.]|uniref:hypothetical protein n=1 Tax=Maridesulfovibrio sp. TaxID=2795000 RepID=UPI0039F0381C
MTEVALAASIDSGVRDTALEPWLPTEKPDVLPDAIDAPTMHQHEAEQQRVTDQAIHSLTGKGNLIDRIV